MKTDVDLHHTCRRAHQTAQRHRHAFCSGVIRNPLRKTREQVRVFALQTALSASDFNQQIGGRILLASGLK